MPILLRKENIMTNWQYLLLAAVGGLLIFSWGVSAVRSRAERKHREFTRSLETLLQPRETVKVICPQKGFRCILTNSRILFERRGNFSAYPLKEVRKVQGKNKEGNRTTVPGKMVTLTVIMEQEKQLRNTGAEFEELAKLLQDTVKKRSAKKKTEKTPGKAT